MRDEINLSAKILFLLMVFAFSACQKSSVEIVADSPSSVISSTPAVMPTPDSPIRKIDFGNFTYPWTEELAFDTKTFTLSDGGWKKDSTPNSFSLTLSKVEYGDMTNDGGEEAIVILSIHTGGSSMPDAVYIYTQKDVNPKLLWSFDTGDRAEGGFKNAYAENGELAVELFGDDKFDNGKWDYDIAEGKFNGLCCPTTFTKFRFKWNGKKFVLEGKPEISDYDWRKRAK